MIGRRLAISWTSDGVVCRMNHTKSLMDFHESAMSNLRRALGDVESNGRRLRKPWEPERKSGWDSHLC